jgi:glycosyltransferase involved in cell wall biosynthesis
VLVDDGSRDNTAAVVQEWLPRLSLRYVALSRNFGKEAGLTAGLAHARGDAVVLMDADMQHPVEIIPEMLRHWRDGAEMVLTVRQDRDQESLPKRLFTRAFYRMVNFGAHMQVPEDAGDFRLLDRRVVDALLALPERNRFMKGLYAWVGYRTVVIPYMPRPRLSGETTFRFWKLLSLGLSGITAFSAFPLRLISMMGIATALASFVFGLYIIYDHYVEKAPVAGWATIVVAISFFASAQMIATGILGEYLARVYDEVKQRPTYLVARDIDGSRLPPRQG